MKSIYLASAYETKQQMHVYARVLRACGFTVVSTWHDQEEPTSSQQGLGPIDLNDSPEIGLPYALKDLSDVDQCDTLILFSIGGKGRGGRHTEFGYAFAKGKGIILIGPREHVFHCLPGIDRYEEFTDFVANLSKY